MVSSCVGRRSVFPFEYHDIFPENITGGARPAIDLMDSDLAAIIRADECSLWQIELDCLLSHLFASFQSSSYIMQLMHYKDIISDKVMTAHLATFADSSPATNAFGDS